MEVHGSHTVKPHLENFEHYFASVWDECNCVVVWTFFGIALLWDWNENWPFPNLLTKCGPLEKGMANHFSILALRTLVPYLSSIQVNKSSACWLESSGVFLREFSSWACRILALPWWIEPGPLAVKAQRLNCRTTKEFPGSAGTERPFLI